MIASNLKRKLENILQSIQSGDFIEQQDFYSIGDYLSREEVNMVYSEVAKAAGNKNCLLIGGGALQRYFNHSPKDVDIMIGVDFKEIKDKLLSRGFSDFEFHKTPFFGSKIYSGVLKYGDKKFVIDLFSYKGVLDRNETFQEVMNNARIEDYKDSKVYYSDINFLVKSKYRAWKNRLFNARGDKDIIEIFSPELLIKADPAIKKKIENEWKEYKNSGYSKLISAFSAYAVCYFRNLIRN